MGDWAELLIDPRTIRAIFGETAPSLDQVELVEIVLDVNRGPDAILRFDLAEFPSDPPKKWRDEGCNTVQVRLRAGSVQTLEIRGLLISPILDLKILRDGELLRVQGATGGISIDIASEFLDVGSDSVSAYVNDPSW
jgi:immunity protein 50 of polymorphic toxin system